MDEKARFESAVARSKALPEQPNDVLLRLYGLYKQATEGECGGARPGIFDPKGRAKWDAWAANRGMSAVDAMARYADLVAELTP